jgi:hypothetical protein
MLAAVALLAVPAVMVLVVLVVLLMTGVEVVAVVVLEPEELTITGLPISGSFDVVCADDRTGSSKRGAGGLAAERNRSQRAALLPACDNPRSLHNFLRSNWVFVRRDTFVGGEVVLIEVGVALLLTAVAIASLIGLMARGVRSLRGVVGLREAAPLAL